MVVGNSALDCRSAAFTWHPFQRRSGCRCTVFAFHTPCALLITVSPVSRWQCLMYVAVLHALHGARRMLVGDVDLQQLLVCSSPCVASQAHCQGEGFVGTCTIRAFFGTLLCASAFGMLQDFKVESVLQRPCQMTVCGEFAAASSWRCRAETCLCFTGS